MSEYIDRDLALSHPYANGKYDKVHANIAYITGFESYKEWLETLPKADVRENVQGKWISELELYGEGKWNYQCSVCGRSIRLEQNETLDDYPFCHCGADMRGE